MRSSYQSDSDGYYTVSFDLELGIDSPVLANASVTVPYASGASEETPWVIDGSVFLYAANGDSYPQATSGAGTFRLVASADGFILTNRTGKNWQPGDTLRFTVPYEVEVFSIPTDGTPGQVLTRVLGGSAWEDAAESYPEGGVRGQFVTPNVAGDGYEWQYPAVPPDEVPDTGNDGGVVERLGTAPTKTVYNYEIKPASLRGDSALFETMIVAQAVAITSETAGTITLTPTATSPLDIVLTAGMTMAQCRTAIFTKLNALVAASKTQGAKAFSSGLVVAGIVAGTAIVVSGNQATIDAVQLRELPSVQVQIDAHDAEIGFSSNPAYVVGIVRVLGTDPAPDATLSVDFSGTEIVTDGTGKTIQEFIDSFQADVRAGGGPPDFRAYFGFVNLDDWSGRIGLASSQPFTPGGTALGFFGIAGGLKEPVVGSGIKGDISNIQEMLGNLVFHRRPGGTYRLSADLSAGLPIIHSGKSFKISDGARKTDDINLSTGDTAVELVAKINPALETAGMEIVASVDGNGIKLFSELASVIRLKEGTFTGGAAVVAFEEQVTADYIDGDTQGLLDWQTKLGLDNQAKIAALGADSGY